MSSEKIKIPLVRKIQKNISHIRQNRKIVFDTTEDFFERVGEHFFINLISNAFLNFLLHCVYLLHLSKWNCVLATPTKVVMEAFFSFPGYVNHWIQPPPPNELTLSKGVSIPPEDVWCQHLLPKTRCSIFRFIYTPLWFVSFNFARERERWEKKMKEENWILLIGLLEDQWR